MENTQNPHTPSLEDLRSDWVWAQQSFGHTDTDLYNREFLLAINKIKADTWDEGFFDGKRQEAEGDDGPRFENPYR